VFRKIKDTFLGISSLGRKASVLLITEPGEFTNMERFLFIECVPERTFHSSEDTRLIQ
jgi:hypothetical protein